MRRIEQRRIKKRIYSWWSVAILLVIAVVFLMKTWDVYEKYTESKNNISGLHQSYADTQDRKGELEEKIEHLNSDRGLDEEIRERFNVAKSGEEVIVIIDPKTEEEPVVQEDPGFVKSLWEIIAEVFR